MRKSNLVTAKTYFGYPFTVVKKSGKVTLCEKYAYIVDLAEKIRRPNMYGLTFADFYHDVNGWKNYRYALDFVKECCSYEYFRLRLTAEPDAKNVEAVILVSLITAEYYPWVRQMREEDSRLLNSYANDPDFSKLVDYIENGNLYSSSGGLF